MNRRYPKKRRMQNTLINEKFTPPWAQIPEKLSTAVPSRKNHSNSVEWEGEKRILSGSIPPRGEISQNDQKARPSFIISQKPEGVCQSIKWFRSWGDILVIKVHAKILQVDVNIFASLFFFWIDPTCRILFGLNTRGTITSCPKMEKGRFFCIIYDRWVLPKKFYNARKILP